MFETANDPSAVRHIPGGFDKSNARWWVPEIPTIAPETQQLLTEYAGIPASEVGDRVARLRDDAWSVSPYPCIGRYRFLNLGVTKLPQYGEIVERVRAGQTFLDLGCCFAQELRRVVFDAGADGEGTYAVDLYRGYLDLGSEFFGDKETLKTRFVAADIFDESPGNALVELEERGIDVIYAGSFLHLFDWEHVVKAARRIAKIMAAKPGSIVVGRQGGKDEAKAEGYQLGDAEPWFLFRHNEESFKEVWRIVAQETGIDLQVEVELREVGLGATSSALGSDEGRRTLTFCVRRV